MSGVAGMASLGPARCRHGATTAEMRRCRKTACPLIPALGPNESDPPGGASLSFQTGLPRLSFPPRDERKKRTHREDEAPRFVLIIFSDGSRRMAPSSSSLGSLLAPDARAGSPRAPVLGWSRGQIVGDRHTLTLTLDNIVHHSRRASVSFFTAVA